MTSATVDPTVFKTVLGNHPTGVAVVTAVDEHGAPAGMVVGTFLSVSLDPPLVGFFPDRGSSSFPRIRTATSFCVNVLSVGQEGLCARFANRGGDKFADLEWTSSPSGAPLLSGVAAWIDCDFHSVTDAGDHLLVLGRVVDLTGSPNASPLVFLRGALHRTVALGA